MQGEIKNFIKRFHLSDNIDEVFTCGCCYWFAYILSVRFADRGAEIMFDSLESHFAVMIDGRVYDITGDVTEKYNWIRFSDLGDESREKRIIRDCIMF